MSGIIGKKVGMTRIFTDDGEAVPVTVLEAGPCPILQVKTEERDGYRAIQIGYGQKKEKRASKAELGHAEKAGIDAAPRILREFALGDDEEYEAGQEVTVEAFEPGERVRVTGTSKGRGFTGVVKRHGFSGRPATHGHPMSRNPGSIGPGTDPSRVISCSSRAGFRVRATATF